jgi:hypothetical protein
MRSGSPPFHRLGARLSSPQPPLLPHHEIVRLHPYPFPRPRRQFSAQPPPILHRRHLFSISPAGGALTSVHVASSSAVEGVTGKYFVRSKPVRPNRAAQDKQSALRLWELSEQLTGVRL